MKTPWLACVLLASACAAPKHAISGTVVDRNGRPVPRANVRLEPGNVEIITDTQGGFTIDYLRDNEGNRTRLQRRTKYAMEFFKVGYHPDDIQFDYKRGELLLEPVTLVEDTIKLAQSQDDIDPAQHPDRAQGAGGSYEGE